MTTDVVNDNNYLSPIRFAFQIDTPDLENISFHCQKVNIPGLSTGPVQGNYQGYGPKFTGDRLVFDNFQTTFIVDEQMDNYSAVYTWLFNSVVKQKEKEQDHHKDVALLIYNNNNNFSIKIKFISAIPVSLSPVEFTVTNTGTEYLYADVSFAMDYYIIEPARAS